VTPTIKYAVFINYEEKLVKFTVDDVQALFPPDIARVIGRALIDAADEVERLAQARN
jgi:hypothetical protein